MIIDNGSAARPSSHAHRLVRETAGAMAHELYDTLMSGHLKLYEAWKLQNPDLVGQPRQLEARFVVKVLPEMIPGARANLAHILRTTTDAALAETIYEALCLDATLLRGRGRGKPN